MPEKSTQPDAYNSYAEIYAQASEYKPYNAYYDRPAVLSLLPEVQGLKVLDAGSGPGIYATWLLDHGASVIGIDGSPKLVEIARTRTGGRGTFHVADLGQPLDFLESDSFDLVLSALTIHYIRDLNPLFAEFARLLKPGGHFVFSTHHPFIDYLNDPSRYFQTELCTEIWHFEGQPAEVSFYHRPLGAITEALSQAGFVIERLIEPLPTEEFKQADPAGYEKLMARPNFLAVRARVTMPHSNSSNTGE